MTGSKTKYYLDNFLPLGAASYFGYKQYKAEPDNIQKLLIMVAIIYIGLRLVIPKVSGEIASEVDKPKKSTVTSTGTPVPEATPKLKSLTDQLYEDIDGLAGHSSDLYETLAALPAMDLLVIYNDWQDRYYHKDKETVIQALDNETYWFGDASNVKVIISKIQSIM